MHPLLDSYSMPALLPGIQDTEMNSAKVLALVALTLGRGEREERINK